MGPQTAIGQHVVFAKSFRDVVAEVCDGVNDGWLLGSRRVALLHQVVLLRDEIHRGVGDAVTTDRQSDGVVDMNH